MLPDFPELKAKLGQILDILFEQRRRHYMVIWQNVPSYRHYEGNRWLMIRDDGSSSESDYSEAASSIEVDLDEAPYLTGQQVVEIIDKMAKDIAEQVEKNLNQLMLTELKANDRILHSEKTFDKDMFLDLVDSIYIEFDEQGNPIMPTMYISPENSEQVVSQIALWKNDPEMDQQFDNLMKRKREEWRARESSRRLVE